MSIFQMGALIDWNWWSYVAGTFGGFATFVTLLVAIGALIIAQRQISAASKVSREAGATQAFRDCLKICFDQPEFSSTEMFLKAHPDVDLETIETALTPATEKYLWFLSILLSACEEITTSVSAHGRWRRFLLLHITFHAPVFRVLWPKWRKSYTGPVRDIVDEVVRGQAG